MKSILILLILAFPLSASAIMTYLPAGTRTNSGQCGQSLGTPEGEEWRGDREGPQDEVTSPA